MRAHLRYLKYVLLHKLYVAVAMLAIRPVIVSRDNTVSFAVAFTVAWARWLWRALVHDASKFRPSEWRPYVAKFYGPSVETAPGRADARKAIRQTRFDRAWLAHQHRNPHHWQHWVLREDSGVTKVLLMPVEYVDEMVADWIGAGTKILRWPSLAECVAETISWYAANREKMQLRAEVRARVEIQLHLLASRYGIVAAAAQEIHRREAAASLLVPDR
jgi:hypothetical protein